MRFLYFLPVAHLAFLRRPGPHQRRARNAPAWTDRTNSFDVRVGAAGGRSCSRSSPWWTWSSWYWPPSSLWRRLPMPTPVTGFRRQNWSSITSLPGSSRWGCLPTWPTPSCARKSS